MNDQIEQLTEILKNDSWRVGDGDIEVVTKNTTYHITRTGVITGGRFKNGRTAKVWGAVTYAGGPIKMSYIVIGLAIEGRTEGKHSKVFCSSVVKEIRRL